MEKDNTEEVDEPELRPPVRTAPYNDSGEWTGCRCPECTYTTYVDAAAGEIVPAFCGVCGNQLTKDQVLEIRNRTPSDFREAASADKQNK